MRWRSSGCKKILDTQPYVYTSKYVTKEQAAKSFKKEMGEDFERILGAKPIVAFH